MSQKRARATGFVLIGSLIRGARRFRLHIRAKKLTETVEAPITQLPQSFFDRVGQLLQNYSIGLYRIEGSGPTEDIVLLGSGTLIHIGEIHAILTAHHVIEVLPRQGLLGILTTHNVHRKGLDVQRLTYLRIARGSKDSEGPDIGAIILSPSVAGTLAAEKSFYDLRAHRDEMLTKPPARNIGVWFAHGFVEERTVEKPGSDGFERLKNFCSFTGAGGPNDDPIAVGDHDYYRFPITEACRAYSPESYGGISGGGLWQIPIRKEPNGVFRPLNPLLSGVVFFQEPEKHGALALKCHGRKSVYSIAYDAIFRG